MEGLFLNHKRHKRTQYTSFVLFCALLCSFAVQNRWAAAQITANIFVTVEPFTFT